MRLLYLFTLFFFASFASRLQEEHNRICVFLNPKINKAEMHPDPTRISFVQQVPAQKDGYQVFTFLVENKAQLCDLFNAMNEAEQQAKMQKVQGESQWIKEPGQAVVLRYPPPK